ncbi:ethanolamine ammonia-lyase subunit EutB [soil metagenome]
MTYAATLRGQRYTFADLRELMGKANEQKSGDALAGVAATSQQERVAAKIALADVRLSDIVATPLIEDDVTALIETGHDLEAFAQISSLTVGEFRELVLDPSFPALWSAGLADAVTPEIAAATAKLMGNKDLVLAGSRLRVVTRCRNTVGEAGVFAVRLQPNHPTDDPHGVVFSVIDGLRHGSGDAVIGINPAEDAVESIAALEHLLHDLVDYIGVPTQTCVLGHVTTQLEALRRGAPVDLLFQSLAGTQEANASFGVSLEILSDGREEVLASHRARPGDFIGENVMYFETGQGSALSAGAHYGIDQLTLEARAQGVARAFDPFLVNTVVGFIGPEYLADARQITRAGLEDLFTGKLQGLPMGIDVCYTNHVDADQNTNDELLLLAGAAGTNFVMGVPCADDVMLGYQSTSFQDANAVREILGRRPAPEFERWLADRGMWVDGRLVAHAVDEVEARRIVNVLMDTPAARELGVA